VKPTFETISNGTYPISRSLYIYVKKSQCRRDAGPEGIRRRFVSDSATGKGGYLQQRGLIPLPPKLHMDNKAKAQSLPAMPAPKS
jgi:phosphate transport system substrate-binding protein